MKINNIGLSSIIFFITETMFLHAGLTEILNSAETGSIYSIIIGGLLSIIIFFLIIRIINYEKDLNIFLKIEKVYGKKVSIIINFIITLLFTLYFIYMLWSINTYVQNKYLDSTPSFIIIFMFLVPVIMSQKNGIKTISKVSLFLFFITLFIILFSIFNLYSSIEFENFKPLFNTPIMIIIKNSFIFSSYFVTPVFMLLITPKNLTNTPKKINKHYFFFFILSLVNMLLLFSFIIGIFGIDLAKILSYPEYSLMKKINYFDFIQHIENISTLEWLFSIFISSIISLNFIKEYINYLNINKVVFYIIIIICFFLSLIIFNNTTIANNIIKNYFIITFYIPLILIIISFNILKRNKS